MDTRFENHTLPHQEVLATISANDNILVINSSHNVSDGGFLVSALSFCLSDISHEKINKNPPIYSLDAFKEEIEEAEMKFDPSNIWPANKLTSCEYDTNDPYLAPPGSPFVYFDGVIPFRKISCYDKSTKKLRNLSEFSNVALTISLLALNKVNNNIDYSYKDPLSLENVFDLRRISHNKESINWSIGNCITLPTVKTYVNSKSDTIESICKKFRNYIKNVLVPHGVFYEAKKMSIFHKTPSKSIFGCLSSIGEIEFKRPIVDIDIRDFAKSKFGVGDHGEKNGSRLTIILYSKLNEYRKDFCFISRVRPSQITIQNAEILLESFKHFITTIKLSSRFGDALNEIIEFQKALKLN